MRIHEATKADCESVASCLLLAMEELFYSFTGRKSYQVVKDLMLHFVMAEKSNLNCYSLYCLN